MFVNGLVGTTSLQNARRDTHITYIWFILPDFQNNFVSKLGEPLQKKSRKHSEWKKYSRIIFVFYDVVCDGVAAKSAVVSLPPCRNPLSPSCKIVKRNYFKMGSVPTNLPSLSFPFAAGNCACFNGRSFPSWLRAATSPARPLRLPLTSKVHGTHRFPLKLSCTKNASKLATRNQKRSSKNYIHIYI